MSKMIEGVPGLVYTTVSLRYYPFGTSNGSFDIFQGKSQDEAETKLRDYFKYCVETHGHYVSPPNGVHNDRAANNVISTTSTTNNVEEKKYGRGAHFIGTTWVIHRKRGEKLRIQTSDLQKYLDDGYEKGGPRTVL